MSEMHTHVRDVTEADLEALMQIKPDAVIHRDRIRDAQAALIRYLTVVAADEVVGFGCLVYVRPPNWSDAMDATRLPQVVDLQIESSARGRGYGSILLDVMERIAAEHGFHQLYLAVNPNTNPRAYALYCRRGYEPLADEPHPVHWEFVDSEGNWHGGDGWSIDMAKRLTSAGSP